MENQIRKYISSWLLIGVVMVFMQVLIGGITRLTDSGLSITEWKVVEGTLPPLNEKAWEETFTKYKTDAKKQFESLHPDMTVQQFKRIYFWEYFHRLWARSMGLVFIFPFLFFLYKKWINRELLQKLLIIIGLASLEGLFGWIMVASGLNEDSRTWVSAYKLIIHLGIATILFAYLFRTYLSVQQERTMDQSLKPMRRLANWALYILLVQIILGGLMAGMRAGLVHPHFPVFMHWESMQAALNSGTPQSMDDFINYEPNGFLKAIVQILHRATAWILVILLSLLCWKGLKNNVTSERLQKGLISLFSLVIMQFVLGVLTVINSIGHIPAVWGVLHQGTALILLATLVYVSYQLKPSAR